MLAVDVCLCVCMSRGWLGGFLVFTVTYPHVGQTRDPVGSVVNFPLISLNQEIGNVPKHSRHGSDILKGCEHEPNLEPCLERLKYERETKLKKCW